LGINPGAEWWGQGTDRKVGIISLKLAIGALGLKA
jgi:hypothetical protein